MSRDITLYLEDILEAIEIIKSRINNLNEIDFKSNLEKQESIIYRLATIGEAINKIPEKELNKFPDIDWASIISMRNILIHEYYEADPDIIWDTIHKDLDILKIAIKKIKKVQD